jgi:hypothetical protein
VSWHAAPRTVDEDGDEWWERERGRRPNRGGLLEHDDAANEGGLEGGARADGEGNEMGQLGGDEMKHPR